MMERNRLREKEAGITFVGPHKDDVLFGIDDKELKIFGSEGQQRSCVAALRLATWERLYERSKIKPLMLVDDVGMSLDTKRQSKLSEHLSNLGQVFLTSTELTKPASNAHVIYTELVTKGHLTKTCDCEVGDSLVFTDCHHSRL